MQTGKNGVHWIDELVRSIEEFLNSFHENVILVLHGRVAEISLQQRYK